MSRGVVRPGGEAGANPAATYAVVQHLLDVPGRPEDVALTRAVDVPREAPEQVLPARAVLGTLAGSVEERTVVLAAVAELRHAEVDAVHLDAVNDDRHLRGRRGQRVLVEPAQPQRRLPG